MKRYMFEKGFGFITPDDGSADLFAPKRTFVGTEASIREGVRVSYQNEIESRTGKPFASTWQVEDGAGNHGGSAPSAMHSQPPCYGGYVAIPAGGLGAERFSPYGAMPAMGPYGPLPGAMPGMPAVVPGGVPGALPPGWEQVTDPSSGKPYWCNRATGESSWTPPVAVAPAPVAMPVVPVAMPPWQAPSPLPAGWEQAPDPASGRPYYFNRATGQSSWTPP